MSVISIVCTYTYSSEACLYGNATWRSGSKIDGSTKISTSWNGNKAYPRSGHYHLCLGSNPKKTVTIYVNGSRYTKIYIDGDTHLDIVRN